MGSVLSVGCGFGMGHVEQRGLKQQAGIHYFHNESPLHLIKLRRA